MLAKRAMRRSWRNGFVGTCVLLLLAGSCSDEAKRCDSSAECALGEICVGPGAGPFHCLKDCSQTDTCPSGATCTALTSADCPTCDFVAKGCVVDRAY
jgi:hypothetical protein